MSRPWRVTIRVIDGFHARSKKSRCTASSQPQMAATYSRIAALWSVMQKSRSASCAGRSSTSIRASQLFREHPAGLPVGLHELTHLAVAPTAMEGQRRVVGRLDVDLEGHPTVSR